MFQMVIQYQYGGQEMFHKDLKRLRLAGGLSRSALADMIGVKRLTIFRWENQQTTPTRDLARAIATALCSRMRWHCPHCGAAHVVGEE